MWAMRKVFTTRMNVFLFLLQFFAVAVSGNGDNLSDQWTDIFGSQLISLRAGEVAQSETPTPYNCDLNSGNTDGCVEWGECPSREQGTLQDAEYRSLQNTLCGLGKECCATSHVELEDSLGDRCGVRKPSGFANSNEAAGIAAFGHYPWMVAILKETVVNGSRYYAYVSGGSFIHPRVVITTAFIHSKRMGSEADYEKGLWARAGDWDLRSNVEYPPHQDRAVARVIIHGDFVPSTLKNNVALLLLTEPFVQAGNVQMVCLPSPTDVPTDGTSCVISTWSKGGSKPWMLKKVAQQIVGRESCKRFWPKTSLGTNFELDYSLMCADERPGIDDCQIDEGSPLVCAVDGDSTRYIQYGISVRSIACNGSIPNVYTALSTVRQWIDNKLQTFNIDSVSYNYDY